MNTANSTTDLWSYRLEERLDAAEARNWQLLFRGLMIVGATTLMAGATLGGTRFWSALLLVSFYLVGLGLAGAVLIAFEYLADAGWSVALRRVPEAMTSFLPWGGLGVLAVLICHPALYPWTGHEYQFVGFKALWLNRPFFLARAAMYPAIWIGFTRLMVRNSRQEDLTGAVDLRHRNAVISAAFVVTFGLTVWLASVDWLMTLEPDWYSTIFGVYNFSGIMTSGIAGVILLGLWLRRLGPWRGVLNEEHLHDLGKLLFAFCTFWAYIWFSQYMLIWYANISEETVYYVHRVHGEWGSLTIVNLLLNWAIPFFVLLSRAHKRAPRIIGQAAVVVLMGHWLDLYLMIAPANHAVPALPDAWFVGLTLGLVGVAGTVFWRALQQAAVIPVHDRYLTESLHYYQ